MLDTGIPGEVRGVVFHPDGMHLLGGGDGWIGRWRLANPGQEGREATGNELARY